MHSTAGSFLLSTSMDLKIPCLHCSKTYKGAGGLKQHMDKHHPEPGALPKYQCKYCERNHACSGNLKRHIDSCKSNPDRILSGEGQFKCEVCSRGFKQKGNLKKHLETQHGRPLVEARTADESLD